jgi:hypothetical protein
MLSEHIFYLKNDKIIMFKYKKYNIETHRHVYIYSRIQTTDDLKFLNAFTIIKKIVTEKNRIDTSYSRLGLLWQKIRCEFINVIVL